MSNLLDFIIHKKYLASHFDVVYSEKAHSTHRLCNANFNLEGHIMGLFDSITDAIGSAVDYVAENPIKCACVAVATVATGGVALAAAGPIAAAAGSAGLLGATATTGTAISSLSGAALVNSSLAAIGGGALAAGGGGMAAGATAIATAGAVAGATVSTGIVVATNDS